VSHDSFNEHPDAYVVTLDGEIVREAGMNGVIKNHDVADQIRRVLVAQLPEKSVDLFGCFLVRKRGRGSGEHGV